MKTFEKPLSAKEEKEYFDRYRNGDKNAYDILILRNMRLVAHIVKRYAPLDSDRAELISIGTIGLIKAVRSFDQNKGSRFATYAAKCVDNELLMDFRAEKKRNHDVSLNEPIGTDKEGNEISIIDVVEAKTRDFSLEIIQNDDISKMWHGIDSVLDSRERDIIIKRYGLNGAKEMTQREISIGQNISRSYVSRIEKKALEKLKVYLTN